MTNPAFLAFAQAVKIAAGLAQLAVAVWIALRHRTRANLALAVSIGANGVAYAIFNLARPGTRTPGSFALEGRGLFNWIAVVGMIVFTAVVIRLADRRRRPAWFAALALGVPGLMVAIANGRAEHLDLLAFGGTIIYPITALALGALAAMFATAESEPLRAYCAIVSAALVINSVDHIGAGLGAGLIVPSTSSRVELATMMLLLAWWIWMAWRRHSGRALLVIACMAFPFLAGVLVRQALGSYLAVQQSGFIGLGRLGAVAVLAYGIRTDGVVDVSRTPDPARLKIG